MKCASFEGEGSAVAIEGIWTLELEQLFSPDVWNVLTLSLNATNQIIETFLFDIDIADMEESFDFIRKPTTSRMYSAKKSLDATQHL